MHWRFGGRSFSTHGAACVQRGGQPYQQDAWLFRLSCSSDSEPVRFARRENISRQSSHSLRAKQHDIASLSIQLHVLSFLPVRCSALGLVVHHKAEIDCAYEWAIRVSYTAGESQQAFPINASPPSRR